MGPAKARRTRIRSEGEGEAMALKIDPNGRVLAGYDKKRMDFKFLFGPIFVSLCTVFERTAFERAHRRAPPR